MLFCAGDTAMERDWLRSKRYKDVIDQIGFKHTRMIMNADAEHVKQHEQDEDEGFESQSWPTL